MASMAGTSGLESEVCPVGEAEAMVAGVSITNPDRPLFVDMEVTKRDLARYYEDVSDLLLPHLRGRLLSLVRCPRGSDEPCFYQKHPGEALHPSVRRLEVREKEGTGTYLHVDSVHALVALVQVGTLELHGWGSRIDKIEHPDRMVFDLDPAPEVGWGEVLRAARALRERLAEAGLRSWVLSTGGKGLHVVVPLRRSHGWSQVKGFAQTVAESFVRDAPDRFVATMSRAKREGRVFIDHFRNSRGATAILPYSTRARAGAPVAVPLRWDELGRHLDPKAGSPPYHIRNVRRRMAALGDDPWSGMTSAEQTLPSAAIAELDSG